MQKRHSNKPSEYLMKAILAEKGISQKEAADKCKISQSLMSYWVRSNGAVAVNLGKIAKILDIDAKLLKELIIKHL